jgi:hypothetical protein
MKSATGRFYQWLVRLHPAAFRERFGAEMLWVYGEAGGGERPRLLADGVLSLARQWIWRSRYWIGGAAACGALLQLAAAGTVWLGAARRVLAGWADNLPSSGGPSAQAGLLLLGAGLICAALLFVTGLAAFGRSVTRRKL